LHDELEKEFVKKKRFKVFALAKISDLECKFNGEGIVVTLAGYCVIHSTVVPAIEPKNNFAPSEEIDGKELLFSNAYGTKPLK
jgi:hypothetical protein